MVEKWPWCRFVVSIRSLDRLPSRHLVYPMRILRDFEGRALVGDKFLCVVVKLTEADAFVVTAYLTDRVKRGKHIWPAER